MLVDRVVVFLLGILDARSVLVCLGLSRQQTLIQSGAADRNLLLERLQTLFVRRNIRPLLQQLQMLFTVGFQRCVAAGNLILYPLVIFPRFVITALRLCQLLGKCLLLFLVFFGFRLVRSNLRVQLCLTLAVVLLRCLAGTDLLFQKPDLILQLALCQRGALLFLPDGGDLLLHFAEPRFHRFVFRVDPLILCSRIRKLAIRH